MIRSNVKHGYQKYQFEYQPGITDTIVYEQVCIKELAKNDATLTKVLKVRPENFSQNKSGFLKIGV